MEKVFSDLKVIELAGVLAGPSVGYFFAELGATVIKIENRSSGGDVTRSWKLPSEDKQKNTSAYFWSVNPLKTFADLDLSSDQGKKELHRLVGKADLVISNFKPGTEKKLKADPETLMALNPRLIYASINGFGSNSARAAYDLILQAESGFMSINGEPGAQPLKMPVALIDVLAAHHLKEAILIALLQRAKSGQGRHISVSLFDAAVVSLVNQASNWLIAKYLPEASGSLHPNIAPYGEIFSTKDKQLVTFAIGNDKQFAALCKLAGDERLAGLADFKSNQDRVRHREALFRALQPKIATLNFDDLYLACAQQNIPIGKIRNLKEVFDLPEARNLVRMFTHEGETLSALSSIAFKLHD